MAVVNDIINNSFLDKSMLDKLDTFMANTTTNDINRNTFLVHNLRDKTNSITISLVFLKDWDSIESNSYNYTIIPSAGAVITFPCYWIEIPKELAIPYIILVLQDVYGEMGLGGGTSSGGLKPGSGGNISGGTTGGCPCRT